MAAKKPAAITFEKKAAATVCRSCGGRGLQPVLDLGVTALVDTLVTAAQLADPGMSEKKYPLQVGFCPACSLVQTLDTVPPQEVFHTEYIYYASFSETWLEHCRRNALNLIQTRNLNDKSLVIEIASNDGYLLKNFVEHNIPVLGIDPCPGPVAAAHKIGVPTLCEFFGPGLARRLVSEGKRADVVLANNVMAHVADLNGLIAGIHDILADDGVLVTESPYVRDLVDHCEFDTIYHEHLCYYSVSSLDALFRRHGLYLNDIERLPTHGGSLRSHVSRRENVGPRVREMLAAEKADGMTTIRYYRDFAQRVEGIRRQMLEILNTLAMEGRTVAAYGASAKGSTMLSYLNAGAGLIQFVVDKNVHKQGKFMPGVHNPIYAPGALMEKKPDYCVLLVWNLKDEILRQQQEYIKAGGKFIIPIPRPTIV